MKKLIHAVPLLSAFVLGACGGGGGGSTPSNTGSNTSTSTPVSVSLTSSNATDAVAYAYAGMQDLSAQSTVGTSLATGVTIDAPSSGVVTLTLAQLYKGLETPLASQFVTGVSTSQTANCSGGGTIKVSATAANPNQVSNGDSLSITASNCVEGSDILNGTIDYGFSNISGTIGNNTDWSATLSLKFTGFSSRSGTRTLSIEGDMSMGVVEKRSTGTTTATVQGNSLEMKVTNSDATLVSRKLTSYSFESSEKNSPYTFTSKSNYTVAGNSPRIGAIYFTVATPVAFSWSGASSNPSSGSMKVTSADKSSATLTALNNTNVKIDLDKNGDGVTDETINTTWSALSSRI